MPLVEFRDLSKHYQVGSGEPLKALDNVSLSIEAGEYVSIVGPSGSGKSTLLQILGLLDRPSLGTYRLMSKDTASLDDNALTVLRAREIGFVFQFFNLLPRMSVEENIVLPMIYRGIKVDLDRSNEILSQLGLSTHREHTPAQLSGGQQQRVAIARALINRPKIILADEPTGNLPQKQAREIIEDLEKLNREGITLIIVTHDLTIAERADRVIQIVDGRVVSDERKRTARGISPPSNLEKESHARPWNLKLWTENCRMAAQALARNKIRTFLTMLGIIIGVFSVISMLSIGEGAKKDMEYTLRQMGSNMFRVSSSRPSPKGAGIQRVKFNRLSWDDYDALQNLKTRTQLLDSVAPSVESGATVTYRGKDWSTIVQGVDASYQKMRNMTPVVGRFFSDEEDQSQESVCVIGQTVYQNLFDSNINPVGRTLKINMRSFRVLGVLPAKGYSWGKDEDDVVLMPIQTAMKRLLGQKYLSSLFVQARNEKVLDRAIEAVNRELRIKHSIRGEEESDFKIKNFGEIRKTIEDITRTMTKFIGIIALISLLVGGIGIMNIMLVSVTERTREIGVRKAIGAKRRDIWVQFLIESISIGLAGGMIGIVAAAVGSILMTYVMNWEVSMKLSFVLVSFLFALLVGIFFGLYPAYKASKLSPIHALRYE